MNPYRAKKIISIFIFILCFNNISFGIDTNAVKFFPLKVGNKYIYEYSLSTIHGIVVRYKYVASVSQEEIINGKKYYYLNGFPSIYKNIWARLDTLSGCLFKYDSINGCELYPYEVLLDSFNIHNGDTIKRCTGEYLKKCITQSVNLIFNHNILSYTFSYEFAFPPIFSTDTWKISQNFGLTYYNNSGSGGGGGGSASDILKGCILDGIVYGDTSLTDVANISSQVPSNFKLYQNYPNPFNPVTKIKFDVPNNSGLITLKVYDIMGREVGNLFEGNLNAGSYETGWNASELTSGIYFYRLVSGNIVLTQKMLLLK